ncbi:Hypothetical protein FKW44_001563, partial [Caligus rogercresseyi]
KAYGATPRATITFSTKNNTSFPFDVIPDTGATKSIMSADILKERNIPFKRSKAVITLADSTSTMAAEGKVNLTATFGEYKADIEVIVTSSL